MKKKFVKMTIVNVVIALILVTILPGISLKADYIFTMTAIGISIILIELPICFYILASGDDDESDK